MSQTTPQTFNEKTQELQRRVSQHDSDTIPRAKKYDENHPKKEPNQNNVEKPKPEKKEQESKRNDTYSSARIQDGKNPFATHMYRGPRTHFELGPRGLDYSPHRDYASRMREYGPQRSSSVQGHELTEGPLGGELYRRSHYGSQLVQYPDVVFRHEGYGIPGPRGRFSSQEYLAAPQHARWEQREVARQDYRQRRRSQQDLLALGQSTESG